MNEKHSCGCRACRANVALAALELRFVAEHTERVARELEDSIRPATLGGRHIGPTPDDEPTAGP